MIFPFIYIEKDSTWEEILSIGKDVPDYFRRLGWNRWKELVADEPEQIEYWDDNSACIGCAWLDGDWCNRVQLPCAFNPILNGLGMACAGFGYECRSGL